MKSSAVKLVLLLSIIILPLLVWAIISGPPQDTRSRATSTDVPTPSETPPISLTPSTTPSVTPSVTPSATPTITPTPTNMPPLCLGLSANPGAGSKPLTVKFACAGYDANNDITAAEFGFGAGQKQLVESGNVGQYGSLTTTYTYTTPGSYNVTCRVRDNNDSWSNYPSYCTYTVIVSDNALTPTPYRTPAPTQALNGLDGPVILGGRLPTLAQSPTVMPTSVPTISLPTPAPAASLWTNDKVRQLFIMLVVSAVTIIVALTLHSFFDRR